MIVALWGNFFNDPLTSICCCIFKCLHKTMQKIWIIPVLVKSKKAKVISSGFSENIIIEPTHVIKVLTT